MCFNQDGAIPSSNGKLLKLADQFTYLGSNISSTESDIDICISMDCYWQDQQQCGNLISLIKTKHEFFQAVGVSELLYGCTTGINKMFGKKLNSSALCRHSMPSKDLSIGMDGEREWETKESMLPAHQYHYTPNRQL